MKVVKSMLNNEYVRAARNKNGYGYVSPATRSMLTTTEGAPLLPDDEWKAIENYLVTSYWNNRLYNPTPFKTDPAILPYRRFFEQTIRSRLLLRIDEYRRIYDALHISFLPADRTFTMIDDATASDTTREMSEDSENVRFGSETDSGMTDRFVEESGERSDVITEGGTRQNVTDSGTPSGSTGVGSGTVSTEKQQYTGFNASTPHDNTQTVRSVDPARTVETESFTGRTTTHRHTTGDAEGDNVPTTFEQGASDNTHTYDDVTDTGTRSTSDLTATEGEGHRTVSGWGGYDIEASVAANIQIAKTCIADLIAETIREAVILTDVVPCKSGDTDFMYERQTWGGLENVRWGDLQTKTYEEIEEAF